MLPHCFTQDQEANAEANAGGCACPSPPSFCVTWLTLYGDASLGPVWQSILIYRYKMTNRDSQHLQEIKYLFFFFEKQQQQNPSFSKKCTSCTQVLFRCQSQLAISRVALDLHRPQHPNVD